MKTKATAESKKGAAAVDQLPRRSVLRQITDFVFGYDFFISYSVKDGQLYATSLCKNLVQRGYYCRMSTRERGTRRNFDLLGRRALRKASVLVLVGSEAAQSSESVLRDVRRFVRRKKRIIPVSVDGTLDKFLPRKGLLEFISPKLQRINATLGDLATGPSVDVMDKISTIFPINRQMAWRSRIVAVIAVVLAVLASIAGYQWSLNVDRLVDAKHARYVSDMSVLQNRWDAKDWSAAIPMLERHHPQTGPDESRGFEWFYRWQRLRLAFPTIKTDGGEILSLDCSPDGTLFATASSSGPCCVRALASGDLVVRLVGSEKLASGIAFSPDGRMIAGITEDKNLHLWDPQSGRQIKQWAVNRHCTNAFAFRDDDKTMVTDQPEGADVWDSETGELVRSIKVKTLEGPAVFSDNGRFVARLDKEHSVELLDLKSSRTLEPLTARGNSPYMVRFSPDGTLLASQSAENTLRVREVETSTDVSSREKLMSFSGNVYGMAFDSKNRWLAIGGDGTIRIWNFRSGDLVADLKVSSERVVSLAFSHDGHRIIGGTRRGELRVYLMNWADPDAIIATEEIAKPSAKDRDVALAFSADGTALATCAAKDSVRVIGVIDGQERTRFDTGQGNILALKFSEDGRRVGTCGNGGSFKWWSALDGTPAPAENRTCDVGEGAITITPDGEWLISFSYAAESGWVLKRSAVAGAERFFSNDFTAAVGHVAVNHVAASRRGMQVAAVFGSGTDGDAVAVGDYWSGVCRWVKKFGDDSPRAAAFSPDASRLAVQFDSGLVTVYETSRGVEQYSFRSARPTEDSHVLGGNTVLFDAEGGRLLLAGNDGCLRFWDGELGNEILTLKGHKRDVVNAIVSADNRAIATKSLDKTVRIWRLATPAPAP